MTKHLITTQAIVRHADTLLAGVARTSPPPSEPRTITDYKFPNGPRFSISLVEPSHTKAGEITIKYDGKQEMRAILQPDWRQNLDDRVTGVERMPQPLAEEFLRVRHPTNS